jgi:hypothetical protein
MYDQPWTVGQTAIVADEAAPTLVTHGKAIGDPNAWLDLRVAAVGTCTAYTATLWLWGGVTASWCRVPGEVLANTDGVPDAVIGIHLDGCATRFDWVFTGTAGGAVSINWEYRLG